MTIDLLTDQGDEIVLGDGRKARAKINHDDIDPFGEFDCYGKIEWAPSDRSRPGGFDGRARVLVHDYPSRLWWQPPGDIDPALDDALYKQAKDLAGFGMLTLGVQVIETVTDSWGNEHEVVASEAWMGGVEPFPDDDCRTNIFSDLLNEARESAPASTKPDAYQVSASAEIGDDGEYLYLKVGTRLIGVPVAGNDESKVEGMDRLIDAVRFTQEQGYSNGY